MRILMGGSGSTGSSLLRTILSRHPELFSGDELNFFNKEQYFENWQRYKHRCLPRRFHAPLVTKGWFPWPGNALLHKDYHWECQELRALVQRADTIEAFAESFFQRSLEVTRARIWIEKTPSNAYSFRHFLRAFEHAKVIHTTRSPLDAVASLVKRGMSPYFASGVWIYNTAAALSAADDPNYMCVRYEKLVHHPSEVVQELTDFLGVQFDEHMLRPSANEDTEHIQNPGWSYKRTEEVGGGSVGRFHSLPKEVQEEIITALSLLRVSRAHVIAKHLSHASCSEICTALGYEFEPQVYRCKWKILRSYVQDVVYRTCKRYPTHVLYYPVEIVEAGLGSHSASSPRQSAGVFPPATRPATPVSTAPTTGRSVVTTAGDNL